MSLRRFAERVKCRMGNHWPKSDGFFIRCARCGLIWSPFPGQWRP